MPFAEQKIRDFHFPNQRCFHDPGIAVDEWGRAPIVWLKNDCTSDWGSVYYLATRYDDL
jgi:hypothetical protein